MAGQGFRVTHVAGGTEGDVSLLFVAPRDAVQVNVVVL